MTDAAASTFRPWTPPRRTRRMSLPQFLWQSWRDPLQIWSEAHFRELYIDGASPLGPAVALAADGTATLTTSDLAAGTHAQVAQHTTVTIQHQVGVGSIHLTARVKRREMPI